jgi:hypothetical protein
VSIDGVPHTTSAALVRADIARAYPASGGAHGYAVTYPVPAGTHSVCVTARDSAGGADTAFTCRSVVVRSR